MEGVRYSDYTAEKWPWPRKRSQSTELVSLFNDQASLSSAVGKKTGADGKEKAKDDEPTHHAGAKPPSL